jgi:hypothetical protein
VPLSMAAPGAQSQTLDSNHVNLAKFYGPNDDGYRAVASSIGKLCQKATSLVEKNWEKYKYCNGGLPHSTTYDGF